MVIAGHRGATAESNLVDIERIRRLPTGLLREKAIKDMIASNVILVFMKVESYIGLHSNVAFLYDDLIGAGLLGLTESIYELANRETPEDGGNPNGFIGQRIIWAITDAVEKVNSQNIPAGYEPPMCLIEVDPMEIIDTKDLLYASCLTSEDVTIIEMRAAGCKDSEIAKRLDISRAAVGMMRNEIQRRYETLSKEAR
jgi:DNA-directed RNA polymerase specialized sigma subunit